MLKPTSIAQTLESKAHTFGSFYFSSVSSSTQTLVTNSIMVFSLIAMNRIERTGIKGENRKTEH